MKKTKRNKLFESTDNIEMIYLPYLQKMLPMPKNASRFRMQRFKATVDNIKRDITHPFISVLKSFYSRGVSYDAGTKTFNIKSSVN